MPKFRKKSIVIEAAQWDGSYKGYEDIHKKFPDLKTSHIHYKNKETVYLWKIFTLEGSHKVSPGDYIIRGIKGEYYPCEPDIFKKTYEKVED